MPSFVTSKRRRDEAGFTVIELLVAVSVTAVLVTLMVTITINLLNAWNRSSGQLATNASARLILDQISQDLTGAIMRRDGNVWLAATVQGNQTVEDGSSGMSSANWTGGTIEKPTAADGSLLLTGTEVKSVADYRFGQAGVWLRLFTAPPAANDGTLEETSAPRAVSWQIVRRELGSTAQYSYHLFRSEARPFAVDDPSTATNEATDNVFTVGYDLFMDPGATPSYNNGNATAVGNVGNIRRPHADQLIGVDVIDFGIKFYERNNAGNLVAVFPDTAAASTPFTYVASNDTPAPPLPAGTGTLSLGFPVEAEVMVRILTPEGARLIAAFEEGNLARTPEFANDDDFWWDIAIKHSKVYTRRVEIKPVAL